MPADYASTARALSLPVSSLSPTDPAAPSPISSTGPVPPWVRNSNSNSNSNNPRRSSPSAAAARLASTPYSRSSSTATSSRRNPSAAGASLLSGITTFITHFTRWYERLPLPQKILLVAAGLAINALVVLALLYSHAIFAWLEPIAVGWRSTPGGWLAVWLIVFACAFPPMIGYSTSLTLCGFVYGFPNGWPIVMTASVAGATAAFIASRTVFSGYVHRLVGSDKRFLALAHVLRHDGLWVLAAIRLCPLPFSLSNGFLATVPSISPLAFAAATFLSSPKLLVHIFIGSRLALLAESGDDMTLADRAVNYLSMVLGAVGGTAIGLVIYRRTMARAKQLAREEEAAGTLESGGAALLDENGEAALAYDDDDDDDDDEVDGQEQGVMRAGTIGDEDAAALMDDDDISLWETDPAAPEYRDDEEDAHHADDGMENGGQRKDGSKKAL